MKKSNLEALQAQDLVSSEIMAKITGGTKVGCHCQVVATDEDGREIWACD